MAGLSRYPPQSTRGAVRGPENSEALITISSHRRRRSPGIGAISDRVTRPGPSPLERSRRCDGHQDGGSQPTDISMIDRREDRLRFLPWLESLRWNSDPNTEEGTPPAIRPLR